MYSRPMGLRRAFACGVLGVVLVACTDPPTPDAGVDAGPDAVDAGGDAGAEIHLQILGITDFHGRVLPEPGVPGASALAAQIAALEAEAPNSLLVSSGDLIGGSTLASGLLRDEPALDVMDLMGLDVSTVGNHEFDRPFAELERLLEGGCHPDDGCFDPSRPYDGVSFPMLGANVVVAATGEPALTPYVVVEVAGVRVGFVGITLAGTARIVFAPYLEGLSIEDEADTVNRYLPRMRADGAEVIVVLIHKSVSDASDCASPIGGAWYDVERFDPGVDAVFMGHNHVQYACEQADRVFVSAGRWGDVVADVDLTFDTTTRTVVERHARLVPVDPTGTVPAVDAYLAWLEGIVGPRAAREVGRITADISNDASVDASQPAGFLVADAILAAVPGADVAFTNVGGTRTTLRYAASGDETEDGIVTYAELYAMLPFGNDVLTMTLTGAQLEALLEEQGRNGILQPSASLRYTFATSGDPIDPAEVFIDGAPLDRAASYRVAVNSYIAEGGDGFTTLPMGTERTPGPPLLDVVEAYLAASSPYAPPALDRISLR